MKNLALAEAVERRRKALGITQRQLALLAGCSELFVVNLEAGKATVRLDKLLDVLQTLGLEFHVKSGHARVSIADDV